MPSAHVAVIADVTAITVFFSTLGTLKGKVAIGGGNYVLQLFFEATRENFKVVHTVQVLSFIKLIYFPKSRFFFTCTH